VDTPGPVRVLHVLKGLGPGGAERLVVSIAAAADRAVVRHEVAYLLDWKQHLVPELEAVGVRTHLLAGRRGLLDPRWPLRLRRLAQTADVVHLHSPAVAAVARPVLRAPGGRAVVVSTEHNTWGSHGLATRVANAATLPLDRVRWAVSEEVVASEWGPWRAKAEVLVHGIPLAALRARRGERASSRAAHGWHDDDVVVAIVANLRANKDYPNLFAAAAQACATEPRLRFVSVGQGPLEHELRAHLATLGLGDRFVMLGYHADPAAVLVGADVFTLSSRHEGLPISLLEAMALGLPPVVTRVGGNAEVVTHEEDGLLVPPSSPGALADAYVRLAGDPAERARLGGAAAQRAGDFDIVRTARTLEARYRSLASR
jgi:glycosyltransferase involved in cell wall biosynthesis